MTVCAGIHPGCVIPIILDCGTDKEVLLNDPLYLGHKQGRADGPRYDDSVDRFVQAARTLYSKAYIHFEDFGLHNAYGRSIALPYHFICKDQPPGFARLKHLAKQTVTEMSANGTEYKVHQACELWLGEGAGAVYAVDRTKTKNAFDVYLPDQGANALLVSPQDILDIAKDD